jgi:hypothetical protein
MRSSSAESAVVEPELDMTRLPRRVPVERPRWLVVKLRSLVARTVVFSAPRRAVDREAQQYRSLDV